MTRDADKHRKVLTKRREITQYRFRVKTALRLKEMRESGNVALRRKAQVNVRIAARHVRVEQNCFAIRDDAEQHREIFGDGGFAHAAFRAPHRNHRALPRLRCDDLSKLRRELRNVGRRRAFAQCFLQRVVN